VDAHGFAVHAGKNGREVDAHIAEESADVGDDADAVDVFDHDLLNQPRLPHRASRATSP
jgi:hypothetical protein